jgi:hypothetical protein
MERYGPVAYRLKLPISLSAVHDVFHVSQLKKCARVPTEIVSQEQVQLEPDLSYTALPAKVLDCKKRSTRCHTVKMYKILWKDHTEEEATWETEEYLNKHYPGFLLVAQGTTLTTLVLVTESRGEIPLRGRGCNSPGVNYGLILIIFVIHAHHC